MAGGTKTHAALRPDWLALHEEEVLDPARPLIDAHIHLYDRPEGAYLLPDLQADCAQGGHNVVASVYVQARAMYRTTGALALRPVGETEFAHSLARSSGAVPHAAAIIGYADLAMGSAVGEVLDAHIVASPRLRGIRRPLAWDRDAGLLNPAYPTQADLMADPQFHAGFQELALRGLSFEAWVFFHQLPALADLARRFPDVLIVLNHCGGILGIGPYSGQSEAVRATWLQGMKRLAALPNLRVKLGGLGMRMCGFGFENLARPPSSQVLAGAWEPYIGTAIELFGAERCMFESNFPVDKGVMRYRTCWNAFKRLTSGASESEKAWLFHDVARDSYGLRELARQP